MTLLFQRFLAPAQTFDRLAGSGSGYSGSVIVGENLTSALRLIPVYASVAFIADMVACTPVHAYRRSAAGRARVEEQPQLLTNPLPGFDRFVWVQQLMASLLLRGNAYGQVLNRDRLGYPSQVRWLNPAGMVVSRRGALPAYTYNGVDLDNDDVVHVAGLTLPGGVTGLSPISLFRQQIETGMRVDRYTGDWFDTGVAPAGHLKNTAAGSLDPDVAAAAKARFKDAVHNHDFFVSGSEWEWTPLTIPAQDSQFLQTMKATATQIAAIFRLAPEDIGGERGSSLTYSTLEMDELRFNRRTLLPWTTRLEAVLSRLVPNGQYVRFNLDGMVRADLKTRMEAHQIALATGVEVLDEARSLEDKPGLTAAEFTAWTKYLQAQKGAPPAPAANRETGQ